MIMLFGCRPVKTMYLQICRIFQINWMIKCSSVVEKSCTSSAKLTIYYLYYLKSAQVTKLKTAKKCFWRSMLVFLFTGQQTYYKIPFPAIVWIKSLTIFLQVGLLHLKAVTNGKGITAHHEKCSLLYFYTEGNNIRLRDIKKDKQGLANSWMNMLWLTFVLEKEIHPWAQT